MYRENDVESATSARPKRGFGPLKVASMRNFAATACHAGRRYLTRAVFGKAKCGGVRARAVAPRAETSADLDSPM